MAYPIRTCVICSQQFELRPDKPGYANRCPDCTEAEMEEAASGKKDEGAHRSDAGLNAARRKAMRDLLYRKDS